MTKLNNASRNVAMPKPSYDWLIIALPLKHADTSTNQKTLAMSAAKKKQNALHKHQSDGHRGAGLREDWLLQDTAHVSGGSEPVHVQYAN